jgi:lipopolysaccharide/colanic/teichoic acid biosynthesis glycosyltransferase
MTGWQKFLKRALDIAVSVTALIVAAPILVVIALLIRIDSSGPIFFRQKRLGKNGWPFRIYKFRTMRRDARPLRKPDGSRLLMEMDPRVTHFGGFLRRTSLDELPQLFNILKGELSLVGPRPDEPQALELYTSRERSKLKVKPGLTGLAQINGRNAIPWEKRKQFDVEYAENFSLLLDLKVLCRTVPVVFQCAGIIGEPKPLAVSNANTLDDAG